MTIEFAGQNRAGLVAWNSGRTLDTADIGDIGLVADDHHSEVHARVVSAHDTRAESRKAAEQALLKVHNDLVQHFAPVLRWEKTPGAWLAEFGCWILNARPNHWEIYLKIEPILCLEIVTSHSFGVSYRADEAEARRDAEAALRALGVVFRVEQQVSK